MRLFCLPDGLLTNRDRTFLLAPPFDLKLEPLNVVLAGVMTASRLVGQVTTTTRLAVDVMTTSRLAGEVSMQ